VRFKENNKLNPTKRSKPKSMQSKGNQTHGARIIIQSATALMKLCFSFYPQIKQSSLIVQ